MVIEDSPVCNLENFWVEFGCKLLFSQQVANFVFGSGLGYDCQQLLPTY